MRQVKVTAAVLFVMALIGFQCWWVRYKYQDCKRVGHSTLYCVLDLGK